MAQTERHSARNLFAGFEAGQTEHMYALEALGIGLDDGESRPTFGTCLMLSGYDESFNKLARPQMAMEMHRFHMENYISPMSADQQAEYTAIDKKAATQAKQQPGVISLDMGVVKRTVPAKPAAGWKKITTMMEYQAASMQFFVQARKFADAEWAERILAFTTSMTSLYQSTDIFKGQFSIFLHHEQQMRAALLHIGSRRTEWTVTRDDKDLAKLLDQARSQAGAAIDSVRARPHQPPAGGGGSPGGGKGAPASGKPPGGGGQTPGAAGQPGKAIPAAPKTQSECFTRKYNAVRHPGDRRGYCIANMFGDCKNPATTDGCKDSQGREFVHGCPRCQTVHAFTTPASCPNPQR